MLDIANDNTGRLVRLINDILDIERMESGRITLEKRPCRADHLVRRAADAMRAMAESSGVLLRTDGDNAQVSVDEDRMMQTVTNLLSNAIKFSPRGGTVRLAARRRADDVVFTVEDEGRGIPPEHIETIFAPFHQVDSSDSRDKGGTGLGLAICRSIVDQHGGRLWAESTPGQGAKFSFTVPALEETEAVELLLPSGPQKPMLVLLVEDDLDLAQVLTTVLERKGVEVLHAPDGGEAIRISETVVPDLVVLDLLLPEVDGFAVVEWMRHHDRLRLAPLVVYTVAQLDDVDRERLRLGHTEFLNKGCVSPKDFDERVGELLARLAGQRDMAGDAA